MSAPRAVFIGDELTSAGWRLAGLETHAPPANEVPECIERVLDAGPPLVLIGASAARALDAATLEGLLMATAPPVLVVAEATAAAVPLDLAGRVRRALGVG
ncbi:MAG TPA: Vacuolar H+transporting two-sector ATPase F subunit [Gammaproteobacteria bacterium]|nr:Vacuolar H+transporting two-sector ATPase F subunit [Gammaproteobacteria bacterium]